MISSCAQCKTKCCRSGPGPYKSVPFYDWLSQAQKGSDRYNTKCEYFNVRTEKCDVWETAPLACKTYVCGIRTYTDAELKEIDETLIKSSADA